MYTHNFWCLYGQSLMLVDLYDIVPKFDRRRALMQEQRFTIHMHISTQHEKYSITCLDTTLVWLSSSILPPISSLFESHGVRLIEIM